MTAPALELVRPQPEHAQLWEAWRGQADAQRFNPFEPMNRDMLTRRLELFSGGIIAGVDEAGWIVTEADAPVGLFVAHINWRMRTTSIGYQVDDAARGRGVGTEMVRQGLHLLFARDDLRKVVATVHQANVASQAILTRLGFVLEGVRRKEWWIHDEAVDVNSYGILREEWPPHAA